MHIQKYTKAALGHIFAHVERQKRNGEYVKFGNQNIDPSKTKYNYDLRCIEDMSHGQFVKQRCSEVKCLNRKDINVVCSCVVTLPQDYKGNSRKFFEGMADYLDEVFGHENTIGAFVHMDESQAHMHYMFCPVIKDGSKLSAKEVINRKLLSTLHPSAEKYLKEHCNIEAHLLNGATRDGNKAIKQLQQDTAIKAVRKAKKAIRSAKEQQAQITSDIEAKKAELIDISSKVSMLSQERAVEIIAQQYVKRFEGLEMPEHQLEETRERIRSISEGR